MLNNGDLDKLFCLDDTVLIVEQVDGRWTDGPDESVCLDHDVEVDDFCDRDVVGHIDARGLQQMLLSVDDIDELFCLDVNVKHVGLPDVEQMNDPDESISFDCDVEVDG